VTFLKHLQILITLVGVISLPGWALLAVSGLWRHWERLQRWIVAVGLSIAFYPVLFYGARWAIPFLTFGPYKMSAMLVLCAGVIGWRMRDHWKEQFAFDRLEWAALGIFGMTLFTRFWIIRDQPYPAWSDSLHHAILTRLTAVQGQLPTTMEPYFPIPLDQYHLGLYSLTATTQWLAQVPAHTALLWTAQVLNGLCGLGVYLALDRKVGRVGALVGAAVVGLWSHQPAWYVNWGRFTQLSSQTILLIAWLVTWDTIKTWKLPWQEHRTEILWSTAFGATLTGAVFLLHFRVAAFYLPLLAMSVVWELWKARKENLIALTTTGVIVLGVVAFTLITPSLFKAASIYVSARANPATASQPGISASEVAETIQRYYEFSWHSVPLLAAHTWLMILTVFSAVVGIVNRNKLIITALVWTLVLYLLCNTYLLEIPLLRFTNLGAVLIMLYMPIGLIIGSAVVDLLAFCKPSWCNKIIQVTLVIVWISGFIASHIRVTGIELYRYFVTPEDVAAMKWIKEHTPSDARFAVNTCFWLPREPHGTDAGYWIPYFTRRRTTVGAMLNHLGGAEYSDRIIKMSQSVERLENDSISILELCEMGVDYVYIGRRGDFSGPGLNPNQLSQVQGVSQVYRSGLVTVLQISCANDDFSETILERK
jgi:hypothetical protein